MRSAYRVGNSVRKPENLLGERNAARKREVRYLDLFVPNAKFHSLPTGILLAGRTVGRGNQRMSLEQDSVQIGRRQSQRRQMTAV